MLRLVSFVFRSSFATAFAALSFGVVASEIDLVGIFGSRAVIVINGGSPRTLSVGQQTLEGVRLVSVSGDSAVVELEGRPRRLTLGQSAIQVGARAPEATGVTLFADARGHYVSHGSINAAPVKFLIDTGASMVSMGLSDARRAGINVRAGTPGMAQTASGPALIWLHRLDSVRLGDITLHGVDAVIHENDLPFVLLGMSFLNRMDMQREGGKLLLRRRY